MIGNFKLTQHQKATKPGQRWLADSITEKSIALQLAIALQSRQASNREVQCGESCLPIHFQQELDVPFPVYEELVGHGRTPAATRGK
jgi:hypothetical protein